MLRTTSAVTSSTTSTSSHGTQEEQARAHPLSIVLTTTTNTSALTRHQIHLQKNKHSSMLHKSSMTSAWPTRAIFSPIYLRKQVQPTWTAFVKRWAKTRFLISAFRMVQNSAQHGPLCFRKPCVLRCLMVRLILTQRLPKKAWRRPVASKVSSPRFSQHVAITARVSFITVAKQRQRLTRCCSNSMPNHLW